jgi:hypothetical protein
MAAAYVNVPGSDCSQANGAPTASCSGSYYIDVLGGNLFELVDGSAYARANYGLLGVSAVIAASAFDNVGDTITSGMAESSAVFSDTANIYGPRYTTGFLTLRYTMYGSAGTAINQSNPVNPFTGGAAWAVATFLNEANLTESTGPVTGPITDTFTVPFALTSFDPVSSEWFAIIPFGVSLNAHAECTAEGEISSAPRAGTCDASALYYDTFQVNGLMPVDASGSVLSDVTVSIASGTDYNVSRIAESPEPPTVLLIGTALAILSGSQSARAKWLRSRR